MRTTIDIPDDTYKAVKMMAIEEDLTVRQMVLNGLELVMAQRRSSAPRKKLQLPLIRSSRPGTLEITNEQIDELIGFP
jgi:hypothetical protein